MNIDVDKSSGWMPDEGKLDAEQNHILDVLADWIENSRGKNICHLIRGFAGSGKTILLIYAMIQTIKRKPNAKVCLVTYTYALRDLVVSGLEGETPPIYTIQNFLNELDQGENKQTKKFDFMFVDEVQDLREKNLELFKNNADGIVVAGDPDQSIYKWGTHVEKIKEILEINESRCHKLEILYRLPPKVVEIANTILRDTEMIHAYNGWVGEQGQVSTTRYENIVQEAETVFYFANKLAEPRRPSLILLPFHEDIHNFATQICSSIKVGPPPKKQKYRTDEGWQTNYDEFNKHLQNAGLNLMFFGSNNGDLEISQHQPQTYLMTYHSAKGLDFSHVFLPGLNFGSDICKKKSPGDEAIEKTLLFVGLTRTKKDLFISFNSETEHELLEGIVRITGITDFESPTENGGDMPF